MVEFVLNPESESLLWVVRQLTEKKLERKRKNLIRLGVEQGQAYAWSRSRLGGWALAQSPIPGTTISLALLMKRG
jgi:RNA-directed DNA polymerase